MSVQIIRATDKDAQDVVSFLASALPQSWRLPDLPDRAQILRAITHPGSIILIARRGGTVVRLALGWCFPTAVGQGDTAMLDELLVDPTNRGRGIGTELVAAFAATARHLGKSPIEIWATTDFPDEPAAGAFSRTGAKRGILVRQFDWPQEAFT